MPPIHRSFFLTCNFEGSWYPGFLANTEACAGIQAGGIGTFLHTLESNLGLDFERQPYAKRMIAAEQKIRHYRDSHPDAFFARSFAEDPEGSAGLLLRWRDELILGGWNGHLDILPPRIRIGMESLGELDSPEIPRSQTERLRATWKYLASHPVKIFDTVYLSRDRSRERTLIRSMLDVIEKSGTAIRQWELPSSPPQEGDLLKARQALADGSRFTPAADGSLLRILGKSPHETADALAAWIHQRGTAGMVIIADEGLRSEIDAAFSRYHLPPIGSTSTSPHRSLLQILPLALSIRSDPLNPYRLLEFLELPSSPIPRRVAHEIAGVVAEYPGAGGNKWRTCIDECLSRADIHGMDRETLKDILDFWLPTPGHPLYPPDSIPADGIIEVCDKLSSWAAGCARAALSAHSGDDPAGNAEFILIQSVVSQSNLLKDLVRGTGLDSVPQVQLTRLIAAAIGRGSSIDLSRPAVESPYLVLCPAAILAPVDTIVWWNFTGSSVAPIAQSPFTALECRALAGKGIQLPNPGQTATEHFEGWCRPFLSTSRRLVLASHEVESDKPAEAHPIWNAITVGWTLMDQARITATPARMAEGGVLHLETATVTLPPLDMPGPVPEWDVGAVHASLREKESASSLESLVKCPLKYILEYQCYLKPARTTTFSQESSIKGTIGHDLLEELFPKGGNIPDDSAIPRIVDELFDRLTKEEGATLLLPGRELDLGRLRSDIIKAALSLGRLLREHHLNVEEIEWPRESNTEMGVIQGALDILVSDSAGRKMILDMKYSKWGDHYYREYIGKGVAIQLAVYARLLDPAVPVAYVSLKDASIISPEPQAVPGAFPIAGISMAETWSRLKISVESVLRGQLAAGRIRATGIPDDEGAFSYENGLTGLSPPCGLGCAFSPVCGQVWI